MLLTKSKADTESLSLNYDEIFFSIKEIVKNPSISRSKVLYQIKSCNCFAFHVRREWRVCPKGFYFFNELYDLFPDYISFDVLCRFFKIRRFVVYGLLDDELLFPECVDGKMQFKKVAVFDYIRLQSNFSDIC